MRDGVSASRVQVPAGNWSSVLAFLATHFPAIEQSTWQNRLDAGLVLDNMALPLSADSPCRTGMTLFYYRALPHENSIPFQEKILYQDQDILVVDKPHFLPVIPGGRFVQETLLVRLKKQLGIESLSPIHRIDKDTAGLVLFSVNPLTSNAYHLLFRQRTVKKSYEAWAPTLQHQKYPFTYHSRLAEADEFFRMAEIAGEANSETGIDIIEQQGEWARYALHPVTGRQHQLRVHMASLGAPILNDRWYPQLQADRENDFSLPLQLLAKSLAFVDPLNGQQRHFESEQTLWSQPVLSENPTATAESQHL